MPSALFIPSLRPTCGVLSKFSVRENETPLCSRNTNKEEATFAPSRDWQR
jgi:hypothetical protein